ncbi:hypothetical protein [Sphaerimonospora mesophila]|uniref:hypothetical protein n=1 Tax=Sphaerimonospora mesophila TaxID=37483 RepID=UPI0006E1A7BE
MPKLNKVIARLALSTALAGGALTMSAAAASATTAPAEWGWSGACNNFCNDSSDWDNIVWDIFVAGNCGNTCFGRDGWFH